MRWVRLIVTGNDLKYPLRYLMINLLVMICLLPTWIQPAWGGDKKTDFNIPRSSADHALNLFAQQADIQLIYPYDAIKRIKVKGLLGRYTVDEGVQRLLRGTCLKAEIRPDYGLPNQVNNKKGIITVKNVDCRKNRIMSALATAILATIAPSTGLAQENSGQTRTPMLEEVVVTAQRRAERAQDVPVALSAFQSSDIEKFNVGSLQDVAKISPAITFGESNTKMFSTIYLRGVGTYSLGAGVEPSVSVVVDGVPVVQQAQALSNLNDIERIEVLKGPQGTLFGKNASAGVINVVTRDPTEEFEARIDQSITSDEEYVTKMSASGPLSDTVGYRINGYYRDYEGYIDDISRDKTLGDDNAKALRAKLNWDITENLDLRLVGDYSKSTSSGNPLSWQLFDPVRAPVLIPGINPGSENTQVRTDVNGKAEDESHRFGAALNYQWQDHTITFLSSASNWKNFSLNDSDFTDYNVAGNIFRIPGVVQGLVQSEANEIDQYLHELRITSPASDTFEYMAV